MIYSKQDVLESQFQVAQPSLPQGCRSAKRYRGRRWRYQMTLQPTVGMMDSHEDVGDGGFQAGDCDGLAGYTAGAVEDTLNNQRTRQDLLLAIERFQLATLRDNRGNL